MVGHHYQPWDHHRDKCLLYISSPPEEESLILIPSWSLIPFSDPISYPSTTSTVFHCALCSSGSLIRMTSCISTTSWILSPSCSTWNLTLLKSIFSLCFFQVMVVFFLMVVLPLGLEVGWCLSWSTVLFWTIPISPLYPLTCISCHQYIPSPSLLVAVIQRPDHPGHSPSFFEDFSSWFMDPFSTLVLS